MDLRKGKSWTMFGRGQREEIDEEDAVGLVEEMRRELGREVERVREGEGVVLDGAVTQNGKVKL
jgi:hypothetical protein